MATKSVEEWLGISFTTEVKNNSLIFNGATKEDLDRYYKGGNTNAADTTNA